MRPIDANALEIAITTLIYEFECRVPKWSPNDMLTSGIDAAKKYGYKADGAEAALNVIRRMPTIDAEPVKHAYWECGWICSNCQCCNGERGTDYCPYCGARMDGDDNDKSGEVHNQTQ